MAGLHVQRPREVRCWSKDFELRSQQRVAFLDRLSNDKPRFLGCHMYFFLSPRYSVPRQQVVKVTRVAKFVYIYLRVTRRTEQRTLLEYSKPPEIGGSVLRHLNAIVCPTLHWLANTKGDVKFSGSRTLEIGGPYDAISLSFLLLYSTGLLTQKELVTLQRLGA